MEKRKILIIDDEVEFCLLMAHYVWKKNRIVHYCHDLNEGLESLNVLKPDVVLVDAYIGVNVQEKFESQLELIEGYSPKIFLLDSSDPESRWQLREEFGEFKF